MLSNLAGEGRVGFVSFHDGKVEGTEWSVMSVRLRCGELFPTKLGRVHVCVGSGPRRTLLAGAVNPEGFNSNVNQGIATSEMVV